MRLLLALAPVGVLAWWAIIAGLGWWLFFVIAGLYILALAAVVSIGGFNAAVRWFEGWRCQ